MSRSVRAISLLLVATVGLSLAACSSGSGPSTSATEAATKAEPTGGIKLADTKWKLATATDTTVDAAKGGITLAFAAKEISGFSGVNNYFGPFTAAADGGLEFGVLGSTMMAGPDAAMKSEGAYMAVLQTVTGYSATDAELDLFVGGKEVLTYTKG